MVLCSGGPGLADYLSDLAALFTDRFEVVRWDQRGCGDSDDVPPYSVDRSVRDLDAVTAATGGGPIVLLGHSWGATLALRYAIARPARVRALLYVSGTGAGTAWKQAWRVNARQRLTVEEHERSQFLQSVTRSPEEDRELAILQWKSDFADHSTATLSATRLATPWRGINYACNAAVNAELDRTSEQATLAQAATIGIPTLIVHGASDPRPAAAGDTLYRALPRVQRLILSQAGHLPWVEQPHLFRDAVNNYLDRVLPAAARATPTRTEALLDAGPSTVQR